MAKPSLYRQYHIHVVGHVAKSSLYSQDHIEGQVTKPSLYRQDHIVGQV